MRTIVAATLVVRFGCELAALAALGAWGWLTFPSPWRLPVALLAPISAATLWGLLIGPKSRRRARDPLRFGLEVLVFGAAAGALWALALPVASLIFLFVALLTAVLARRWSEGAEAP